MEEFAREAFRILKPDRHLYCFCRFDTYPRFFRAFASAGFKMKRTLIWVKDNHGSGDLKGDYAPRDEWVIFAQKGRRTLRGKRKDNILTIPKVPSAKLRHPTEKPLVLLKLLMEKSTSPGEMVLDPFAGVLTTAEAAMDKERSFTAIETSRRFIQAGMKRLREHPNRSLYDLKLMVNG
jgi:site-specific DNA-methyltransferase (adenine-specific)